MRDQILDRVTRYDHVSFAELEQHLGPDADGDFVLEWLPNVLLWTGCSPAFAQTVLDLLHEQRIHLVPCATLVYLCDGSVPRLPILKTVPKATLKKPHWLPVVLRPGPPPEPKPRRPRLK